MCRRGCITTYLPCDRRLGRALCQLLEILDPARLPIHGGDATTVIVTIDIDNAALLCSHHHHRAHDTAYLHERLPNGDIRFTRRT